MCRLFQALLVYLLVVFFLSSCDMHTVTEWQLETQHPNSQETQTLTAQDAAGKRILINYWAEWCKPCITEIPELNAFAQQKSETALVLAYNFDNKQGEALLSAMHSVNLLFPATLTPPATVFSLPEINGLPTTVVLDEQGRLITVLVGPQTITTLEQALLIP